MKNRKNLSGFTLIEVLIVIGLIAILAAVTIIALNPGQNFADARNSERRSELSQIISALSQWYISDAGDDYDTLLLGAAGTVVPSCNNVLPTAVTNDFAIQATGAGTLHDTLVTDYLAALPSDPQAGTDYTACHTGGNRITLFAPNAEGGEFISVSR